MKNQERTAILNLLGISQKGRLLSAGKEAVTISLQKHKAFLLIVSEDISVNSKEKLLKICLRNKIPCLEFGSGEDIGRSVGRGRIAAVAINNRKMAETIAGKIKKLHGAETMGVDEWPK
ncbi:MAG: ribosomal L7Ae/L30e/S12e/Gadd45 family protein [Syntrophomonadaceae bacterium]|nr:ribosomal L7Ae/L30e/S12e/Gadd45 family protein [Syntrophomonadaceae bacterium]